MQGEASKPIRVVGRKIKKAEKGGAPGRRQQRACVLYVPTPSLEWMPVPPARWKEGLRRAAACSLHVQCSIRRRSLTCMTEIPRPAGGSRTGRKRKKEMRCLNCVRRARCVPVSAVNFIYLFIRGGSRNVSVSARTVDSNQQQSVLDAFISDPTQPKSSRH